MGEDTLAKAGGRVRLAGCLCVLRAAIAFTRPFMKYGPAWPPVTPWGMHYAKNAEQMIISCRAAASTICASRPLTCGPAVGSNLALSRTAQTFTADGRSAPHTLTRRNFHVRVQNRVQPVVLGGNISLLVDWTAEWVGGWLLV